MKKLLVVVAVLLLSGCGSDIQRADLANAEKLCAPNGGIAYLSIWHTSHVICVNGAKFYERTWIEYYAGDLK